jgi:N-terminal domain of anti-restriction factor ArdC
MSKRSSSRLSETELDARRRSDRERLKRAAEELLCSEGWRRWVRVRASFHTYSAGNCMLLALQCHQRGIEPQHVAGFRAWLNLGRCVRRGETALRILAPVAVKQLDRQGEDSDERRVFFKTAFVFELSQTEPLPGVEPMPVNAPCEPLTGDSHAHVLAPLEAFAESLGYSVAYEVIPRSAGGWWDLARRRIVVDQQAPGNARVRTLIHECAHALGIDYQRYSRAQAEVIVDTVTFVVSASVGLAVDGEAIPYVAGWGEHGALEAVTEFAETIDKVARHIEGALVRSTSDRGASE